MTDEPQPAVTDQADPSMSDEARPAPHHHSFRERIDAARAAAEEVVAEESGQLSGEVSALAVPFEEVVAAVAAAIHPDRLAENEVPDNSGDEVAPGTAGQGVTEGSPAPESRAAEDRPSETALPTDPPPR